MVDQMTVVSSHTYIHMAPFTFHDGNHTSDESLLYNMKIPSLVKVHIIALGNTLDIDFELFRTLARTTYGSFHFIELPDNAHLLKHTFDTLVQNYCKSTPRCY
jgi:hypothetical protein